MFFDLFIFCWFCLQHTQNGQQFSVRSRKVPNSVRLLATMAFSVATNNRFDLFVDEDEEPDDLLTKQQLQAAAERQRKDSEKKSAARATSGGKPVPGKGQTQRNVVKPTATSSGNGNRRNCANFNFLILMMLLIRWRK